MRGRRSRLLRHLEVREDAISSSLSLSRFCLGILKRSFMACCPLFINLRMFYFLSFDVS